ncbi:hypothetical protein [Streptomyces roseolilacinus]|nr:hypothetical protein [Streptomyces roseolilacinus]
MTTEPTRHSTPPVELPLRWEREPDPAGACPDCAELVAARSRARARGDRSAVSDCNVLLRRHRQGHR